MTAVPPKGRSKVRMSCLAWQLLLEKNDEDDAKIRDSGSIERSPGIRESELR